MSNAKKILVVDDDPDIVEQVTMILKKDGHEVHEAGTMSEAEEMLLTFKPDLAIIDLMMEEKDSGFVLCHRIKKLYPGTPVIILTAVKARMQALYQIDRDESLRVSHKNEDVARLYQEFLGAPLGELSHKLLHTHYHRRDVLI